ncbi:hypothetical protein ROP_22530 [Rhodococcus opacus B4]|uniref:ABM domain-containing protein n=1 Tax=Rhodococcus opacus (strain B4) TaxID=632772 RepID=C1B276_RHOOB|nr:hypothetical protein ROP_22530 [Rhodococcus opacus B4]
MEDPNLYVLVEAFRDDAAAHVQSDHFRNALATLKPALAQTPRIINTTIDATEWPLMGELEVD